MKLHVPIEDHLLLLIWIPVVEWYWMQSTFLLLLMLLQAVLLLSLPSYLWFPREEALKFLNWLYTDEEAIRILKDCRGVPASDTARAQLEKEGMLDPVVSKAVSLALEKSDEAVPPVNENSEVYGYLFPLMQELCYDMITPEQAAEELITNLTDIVAKIKP